MCGVAERETSMSRERGHHVIVRSGVNGSLFWVKNSLWSPEYPDAFYTTDEDEAIAIQKKRGGAVVRDYGFNDEEVIAPEEGK